MKRTIKPSFKIFLWIIRFIPWWMVVKPLMRIYHHYTGLNSLFFSPTLEAVFLGTILFLIIVIQQAREYRKTSYELSSKWGVSNLNFRGIYRREVLLANVKTIELRISSFQKFFGLGNIIMRTQESGFWRSKTSICLFDIEKPEETYILVKEMVSKASKT